MPNKDFQFVQLSTGDPTKPFDGMAAGSFVDMYGRKLTIRPEELQAYVTNTQASIKSTQSESGEIVGLPIDCRGHDHGDAAGWIVGVELDEGGKKIRFIPRWNEYGEELISRDIQRFFSPTIDVANRVIMGGSLTNWPATRTNAGQILLRPIELSAGHPEETMFELIDGSLDEKIQSIKTAFLEQFFNGNYSDPWPLETFTDHLICEWDGKLWRVDFQEGKDAAYVFQAQTEWKQVKLSYVEAALNFLSRLFSRPGHAQPETITGDNAPEPSTGDDPMPEPTNLESVLAGRPEAAAELNKLVESRVQAQVAELLAKQAREAHIAEFARTATGGSPTCPAGLPVTVEELTKFMVSLTPDQQAEAEAMLEKIRTNKALDFSEHGHNRKSAGAQLPAEMAKYLNDWLAADKANTIAGFFAANASELGAQGDYDLTAFVKPEEK